MFLSHSPLLHCTTRHIDICGSVRSWAASWPTLKVTCATPAKMSLKDQMELLATASVVVSEHGATLYTCMFQVPGSALLVVAPVSKGGSKWAKEPQVMLYLTDLFTIYLDDDRIARGEASHTLQLLLSRAGQAFNLPPLQPLKPLLPWMSPLLNFFGY